MRLTSFFGMDTVCNLSLLVLVFVVCACVFFVVRWFVCVLLNVCHVCFVSPFLCVWYAGVFDPVGVYGVVVRVLVVLCFCLLCVCLCCFGLRCCFFVLLAVLDCVVVSLFC